MKSLTKGNIKTAWSSVRRNKARSFMTMLGIILAVAPVIIIVSIGDGVRYGISQQINHMGKDLITIKPGNTGQSDLPGLNSPSFVNPLSQQDIETVRKTPGVSLVAPMSIVSAGNLSSSAKHEYQASVFGTSADLPELLNQNIDYGGMFDDSNEQNYKVVIGEKVAEDMFNENVPLGQTLSILGHDFIVTGIFSEFTTTALGQSGNYNNAVFIPYVTARAITNNNSPVFKILVKPDSPGQVDTVADSLKSRLLASHGGQKDFSVLTQDEANKNSDEAVELLTAFVIGIAIISLLIGGIGIMNIMLVSVTERMHEVGIRKAVGATNRQILNQFITEAVVLSVAGAVIGTLLALLVNLGLFLYTDLNPVTSWQIIAITFVISVSVGTLFGSIPALKAARKDPINALRNE